ncbi:MAG: hypothetical protein LBB47_08180 [Spirochaetaceae bacterium]|nr:hypothetical protein [Spirochaetaceae bacterium]
MGGWAQRGALSSGVCAAALRAAYRKLHALIVGGGLGGSGIPACAVIFGVCGANSRRQISGYGARGARRGGGYVPVTAWKTAPPFILRSIEDLVNDRDNN